MDWPAIARLSGRSEAQAQMELMAVGAVFRDPESGGWQTREAYLSGNVRARLRAAQEAARLNLFFESNVEALKKVQPEDLKPGEIYAPLGAGWIPPEDVRAFAAERLGLDINVDYVPQLARWLVQPGPRFKRSRRQRAAANKQWGTRYADAVDLLDRTLNGRETTIKNGDRVNEDETYAARDKQQKMQEAFAQWLWADPARARRLAGLYNEQFNNTVRRRYDGSHLGQLPGQNPAITLQPHQKDAIWRGLRSPHNVFLIHATGAGKTFSMAGMTEEMRRLGLRQRIIHVVPNHRPAEHIADYRRLYPQARLMMVTSKELSPAQRAETMARMANFNGSAIIMSHSAMEAIPMSRATEATFIRRQIAEYDETLNRLPARATRKRKELERARDRQQQKLERLFEQTGSPEGPTWESLGIDHMFIDEAHRYKNLEFVTRHQNLSGINPAGSVRAHDFYMKALYTQQRCSQCGRFIGAGMFCQACNRKEARPGGVYPATATPVDNSIAELYTWQRILQPGRLKEMGLEHFDAWAKQFGEAVTSFELSPVGNSYREATRFSKFANVPDLATVFGEVADVQLDPEALKLPLPELAGGQARTIVSPMSEQQRAYMRLCEERAEKVRARLVSPTVDNFLKIANDMHKAALDYRLIDPSAPDDPNSKVNLAVKAVLERYRATTGVELPGVKGKHNLTQVVFLDTSTPKAGFNLYEDMKQKLVKGGIPAEEIAFIHDAPDATQKALLFNQMNQGQVRILLASTGMAGEGANFQRLLAALHHLDTPWTPARIRQREGRIIRQGNLNAAVEVCCYVTEGSSDAYRWQTVERKALSSDQILSGQIATRSTEDIDAVHFDYGVVKALASNNPIVMERVRLQTELQRYQALQRVYQSRRFEAQQALDIAQQELASLRQNDPASERIPELTEEIAQHRTTLRQPFEYEQKLVEVHAALGQVELEIARLNRPVRRKRGGLIARLFGIGGQA